MKKNEVKMRIIEDGGKLIPASSQIIKYSLNENDQQKIKAGQDCFPKFKCDEFKGPIDCFPKFKCDTYWANRFGVFNVFELVSSNLLNLPRR